MSIAGIAKEVTTIAVSAIVFGDELTPLNITGVGVTIGGKFFCRMGGVDSWLF
jgi:solute carrier family 35 protein C2